MAAGKLEGKKIVLGVTASIAAYKSVYLLRLLRKAGAEVKVTTTPDVSHFVGELTFSSLAGHPVFSGLWSENWSEHVALGTWADLMVVAPATANTLAKFAHGLCDNAPTAVYLAARCPVMVAPAMDADMFEHPRVEENLQRLRQDGVSVLPVGQGYLASGLEGPGRMLEPEEIFEAIVDLLAGDRPLSGKKILVSAGPTWEAIDPVRFITNRSTGKMGYALARQARNMGAEVVLVSGPVHLEAPPGVELVPAESAEEMFQAVDGRSAEMDSIIMSAAVADYRPAKPADQKIKKKEGQARIELTRTTDILATLGEKKPGHQILVGFAMETENEEANARKKLKRKNLDLLVLNSLRKPGAGFAHDTNEVIIFSRNGDQEAFPLMSKDEVARLLLKRIAELLNPTSK